MLAHQPHSGFILIHKDSGPSSFTYVNQIKKLLGTKKVGHAGTLDPMAEGLLLLGFGKACALLKYFLTSDKTYAYEAALGVESDTLDATGEVKESLPAEDLRKRWSQGDFAFSQAEHRADHFPEGSILQVPPLYSALKYQGRPLYAYARQGTLPPDFSLEQKVRQVEVQVDQLTDATWPAGASYPYYGATITVSSGFYVRSYIAEIGDRLGCGALMTRLVRTKAYGFSLEESMFLAEIQAALDPAHGGMTALAALPAYFDPLSALARKMPIFYVTWDDLQQIFHGRQDFLFTSSFLSRLAASCPGSDTADHLGLGYRDSIEGEEGAPGILVGTLKRDRKAWRLDRNLIDLRDFPSLRPGKSVSFGDSGQLPGESR